MEFGNVGIIGVGVMGFAMANNLSAAGYQIFGFDPAPAAQDRLRSIGGNVIASPRDIAERCATILFSLPSADALANAIGGEDGVAKASATGTIVIECSTLPLDVKRHALEVLTQSGKTMLDCPVSGTGAQRARTSSFSAAATPTPSNDLFPLWRGCRASSATWEPSATAAS